jgi:hypothetical protein
MPVLEGFGDLPGDRQRFVQGDGAAGDPLGERLSLDQLHGEEAPPLRLLDPVDRRDVGMVERRQQLRLAPETGETLGVGGEGLGQQLDRDVATELGIAGAIHLAHTALAELLGNFVVKEPGADHGLPFRRTVGRL